MTRNKTIKLTQQEKKQYNKNLLNLNKVVELETIKNKIINQDIFNTIKFLPDNFISLLFVDPPYNLTKNYNGKKFFKMSEQDYIEWLDKWLNQLIIKLKQNSSVYICGDWNISNAIYQVLKKYFIIQNRITWEREKGRGSKSNWKNSSEDIWFATLSKNYYFDVDAVKQKKKVIAPYKENGKPKDWKEEENGNFRLTHPSNLWTDITVPFWSMAENTNHPTQKPEKLLAKIILASSAENDTIFDPFIGTGTTAVVAKKLNRNYCGVEIDNDYACLAEKRLEKANQDTTIQGYKNKIFFERNSKID